MSETQDKKRNIDTNAPFPHSSKQPRLEEQSQESASTSDYANTEEAAAASALASVSAVKTPTSEEVKSLRVVLPPYDPEKYRGAKFDMLRMMREWDHLDRCPSTGQIEGDDERYGYTQDMQELLTGDRCSYTNPFGADNRERFQEMFSLNLFRSEKQAFLKLCKESVTKGRRIFEEDIDGLFVKAPEPPYQVDLGKNELVKNEHAKSSLLVPYRDGSDRHPFLTLYEAQEAMENISGLCSDHRVFVKCASTCHKVECADPGCKTMVCKGHAEGFGVFDDDEERFVFHKVQCTDCERFVCDHHHCDWFRDCDVCSNNPAGDMSFAVCPYCGNTCPKTRSEADGDFDDESENDEDSCEEETRGFYCCNECFKDHINLNDPTSYC